MSTWPPKKFLPPKQHTASNPKTPRSLPNGDLRGEVDLLRQKITDQISKKTQKSAVVLTDWISKTPLPKKSDKKAA